MQFTITEAARLYKKQRKTLYRHIETGRLSCGYRGDGTRVIDLSELIRCYGEPPQALPANDTHSTRDTAASDTLITRALLDELRALRLEVEQLRADLRRLPPPNPPTEAPQAAQTKSQGNDPHGLRALARAMYASD